MPKNTSEQVVQSPDSAVDVDIAALDAHMQAIDGLHRAAFRGPAVDIYEPGATVWMYDHYNTALVEGAGRNGTWRVTTADADGSVSSFEYEAAWLRPAIDARVFTRSSAVSA